MKKQQSGFTLIELIAVIVILGILAATAVPKFLDLSVAAETAALSGIAAGYESASSLNYAHDVALAAKLQAGTSLPVTGCTKTQLDALMVSAIGNEYTVTGGAIAEGATVACTLTLDLDATKTTTFNVIGVVATTHP